MRLAAVAALLAMIAVQPSRAAMMPPVQTFYEPREGDFSIAFPGQPLASVRLARTRRERAYMDNEGDQLFMVTAAKSLFAPAADDLAFAERLRKFGLGLGASLVSSRRLTWCGGDAYEGVYSGTDHALIIVRMTVRDKRLYQVIYQGRPREGYEAVGRRFLDSFRLTDRSTSKPVGGPGI